MNARELFEQGVIPANVQTQKGIKHMPLNELRKYAKVSTSTIKQGTKIVAKLGNRVIAKGIANENTQLLSDYLRKAVDEGAYDKELIEAQDAISKQRVKKDTNT